MTLAIRLAVPENGCKGCPPTPAFAWAVSPSLSVGPGLI
jgi:hypothetical protein